MIISVHGPIGVGKSTFIDSHFQSFIKIQEPLDQLNLIFQPYYNAIIKAQEEELSQEEQDIIVQFQVTCMLNYVKKYRQIEPDKNYIFERSIQEDYYVFCLVQKQYLDAQHFDILTYVANECMFYEPVFYTNIYLKEERKTILQRIYERKRQGEKIPIKYQTQLEECSNNFLQKKQVAMVCGVCQLTNPFLIALYERRLDQIGLNESQRILVQELEELL